MVAIAALWNPFKVVMVLLAGLPVQSAELYTVVRTWAVEGGAAGAPTQVVCGGGVGGSAPLTRATRRTSAMISTTRLRDM